MIIPIRTGVAHALEPMDLSGLSICRHYPALDRLRHNQGVGPRNRQPGRFDRRASFLPPCIIRSLAGRLIEFCRTESVANLVGFLIIFIGCLLIGAIIALCDQPLHQGGLASMDRPAAGRSVRASARLGHRICPGSRAHCFSGSRKSDVAHPFLAPYLLAGARTAVLLVPQDLKDQFNEQYKKVLQAWNQSRSAS